VAGWVEVSIGGGGWLVGWEWLAVAGVCSSLVDGSADLCFSPLSVLCSSEEPLGFREELFPSSKEPLGSLEELLALDLGLAEGVLAGGGGGGVLAVGGGGGDLAGGGGG